MALGPGPLDLGRPAAQLLHRSPYPETCLREGTQALPRPGKPQAAYALSALSPSPPCSPRGPEAAQGGSKLRLKTGSHAQGHQVTWVHMQMETPRGPRAWHAVAPGETC